MTYLVFQPRRVPFLTFHSQQYRHFPSKLVLNIKSKLKLLWKMPNLTRSSKFSSSGKEIGSNSGPLLLTGSFSLISTKSYPPYSP